LLDTGERHVRVLVISGTFPPIKSGGAEYAFWLCKRLAESRLDVHVLTSSIDQVVTDPGIRLYPVMQRWSWSELPRLLRIVARCRPAVVNIHFAGAVYRNQPMITFLPSVLKRLSPRVSVVTHIEYPTGVDVSLLPFSTRVVRKVVARWVGECDVDWGYGTLLRDSDRLIVLCNNHRHVLSKHLSIVHPKCVLIPPPPNLRICEDNNGAARGRGRELLCVAPEDFLLAYYGYLYPSKGIETLLAAVQMVAGEQERVRLVLIGGSNEVVLRAMNRPRYAQELQDLSEQLGIANKVRFTGFCPSDSDQASTYLRGADACVLPFDDGVMLHRSSVAASAAHGLPIITTIGEILESAFIDKKNVLLCSPNDPKSLAAAICTLISDSHLQQRLRAGSLELAREWFSSDKAVERTIEVFEQSSNRVEMPGVL